MTKRSVAGLIILSIVTFGIYYLYWYVVTKLEMNEQGAEIPTAWLMLLPIANIYFKWRWSEGVEHVTRGRLTAAGAFLLMFLLPFIGAAIVQATLNEAIRAAEQRIYLPEARIVS